MALEYEDPFSLIYATFWEAVEENSSLKDMVREGNRIKFIKDGPDHEPRKPMTTQGSTPELILVPDLFIPTVTLDNAQAEMARSWNWVIRTGDRLLHKALFPVEYNLFLAMLDAKKRFLKLKWKGSTLVNHFSIDRGSASIPDIDRETRNPLNIAWYSIWTMTTKINFVLKKPDQ